MSSSNLIKNKKVSVLMCFYERPSFVPLIVHNLKSQTFISKYPGQVEFIVADDSVESQKLDEQVLKSQLKGIIDDVTVLRLQDKLTIGQKRNLLCRTAKYGILIFMDDDDFYFPSYIEYSLIELCRKRKSLVGSNSMLFCYVNENFKKLSINCMSPRQIHEATMCMLKSHWEITKGFNERGNGEGANLIDGNETKVNAKLDISKLMVCVCHTKNTCNKHMFLANGTPADYIMPDNVKNIINECINHPLYLSRTRICFKYPSRGRPEQFKTCFETYTRLLSKKHDYHFVISMDTNDTTMNTDDIKTFLTEKRKEYQLEYYYGESKNKIDAVNRDMLAPSYDILVLISDDMIPQVENFDDIIVEEFKRSFPDYDGMLNFNDGLRKDWPRLCTLTVYGLKYYQRFGYIYHPDYISVYCDDEQTQVGRMLQKIKDIDQVIIKHEWDQPQFQDELRRSTEHEDMYKKDEETFKRRKSCNFDLISSDTTNNDKISSADTTIQQKFETKNTPVIREHKPPSMTSSSALFTIVVVSHDMGICQTIVSSLQKLIGNDDRISVIGHYNNTLAIYSLLYLHRLSFTVTTPFVSFYFPNESCLPTYIPTVMRCLVSNNSTVDVITFKQECSFDNGKTTFLVDSNVSFPNEEIPAQGPWKSSYQRNVCNWSIYRTSLWHDISIKEITDETSLMQKFLSRVRTPIVINDVLYRYCPGVI